MTNNEIIEFLVDELISNYIAGERSDKPCEYYAYNNYGKGCTRTDCDKCLIEYLEKVK